MVLSNYKEPGPYVTPVSTRAAQPTTTQLVPCIVGEGPQYNTWTDVPVVVNSGAGTYKIPYPAGADTFLTNGLSYPTNVTSVVGIVKQGDSARTAISNVTLNNNQLVFPVDTAGATYLVTFKTRPEVSQYSPVYATSFDDINAKYQGQFMADASGTSVINPLYMGAYLALESGAPGVWCVQVKPVDIAQTYTINDAVDFGPTIAAQLPYINAYQIVAMTQDSTALGALKTHLATMSSVEERKERITFVTNKADGGNDYISDVQTAASGYNDKRVRIVYPDAATKYLSDGKLHVLKGQYLCAAVAGLDASLPVQRSLTRQKLLNFVELRQVVPGGALDGTEPPRMIRSTLNTLASYGVMVLEQPGGIGTSISIRHQLTTSVAVVSDREHSIVKIADYTAKSLRNSLDAYIGTSNIDMHLLTRVSATITVLLDTFSKAGILNAGRIKNLAQDADYPDTLVCEVEILPPYPCNYINITLVLN